MIIPTVKLFNAIQVPSKKIRPSFNSNVLKKTIEHGFILDPNIIVNDTIIDTVKSIIGINGQHLNSSFHKSWKKVKYGKIENLIVEQMVHYLTTYGFEKLDCFDSNKVFIPKEKLEIPKTTEDIPLVMIKALTKEEVLEKVLELGSGIALGQETLDLMMEIIEYNGYSSSIIEEIQNRELKIRLYNYYDIVPSDPLEFLRYLVYMLTEETLLIKNKTLIDKIKMSDRHVLDKLIKKAPDNLASIFLRYKSLFLAMKYVSANKTFFNQLRKKAKKQHKPLPIDYFNSITELISKNMLDLDMFKERLNNISIYRKIRLAYSINYRLLDNKSIVYKIRNGKSWATDCNTINNHLLAAKVKILLINSISKYISNNVKGKKIYIPNNINYALPLSEKSFIGNIPTNSSISLDKDIIIGVHWFNNKNRVDLDLSMIGNSKIGWDGSYRSGNKRILFSGDMTDAPRPNGASEMFYISDAEEEPWVLNLNNYTHGYYGYDNDNDVPFKLFIANKKLKRIDKNYMVDPNDIVLQANMNITDYQKILGLIIKKGEKDNRFYFSNFNSGNSISAREDDVSKHIRNYMIASSTENIIDMRTILEKAGAILTDTKDNVDIDLSPESLDKTTIVNLLK